MVKVIGVHSSVAGAIEAHLTDGHAWITMHFQNGRSTTVGLWNRGPLEARNLVRDPIRVTDSTAERFDVQFGLEDKRHYRARASRYYGLTQNEGMLASRTIGVYTGWRVTNTCATWATRVVKELTGEELDSPEFGGLTNTPRALGSAILLLESTQHTTLEHPKMAVGSPVTRAGSSQ